MNHHARQSLQEQQAQLSRTIANRQRKREAARERLLDRALAEAGGGDCSQIVVQR